ncbi:MAG: hypothetical protein ACE37J_02045 [Pikeienuella sp.]|uniref:hypothetical protein n=1 Tax=Pikeienuella sp. TaxID=2831957 RepID=UPI00391DFF0A
MTRHVIDDRKDERAAELARVASPRARGAAEALEKLRRQERLRDEARTAQYARIERGREA